ncbi:hypothetical protein CKO36_16645 [Rhabdochromatium marinum]|nr:hypothetical protein [Rhabdochromatium marinum]
MFTKALAVARQHRLIHWEGVIAERAAWFWEAQGNDRVAQGYWQQAYDCFSRWGAQAKLRAMERHYRDWIAARLPASLDEPEFEAARAELLDHQVTLLRLQLTQTIETDKRLDAERHARELDQATQRLREEVAQRKQIEADLRQSEELFRLTFDESPIGAAMVSNEAGFLRVNRALCELLGYSEQELTRLTVDDVTHPDDLQLSYEQRDRFWNAKITKAKFDKRYLTRTGETV